MRKITVVLSARVIWQQYDTMVFVVAKQGGYWIDRARNKNNNPESLEIKEPNGKRTSIPWQVIVWFTAEDIPEEGLS